MHVISRKKLLDFCQTHPQAYITLDTWYRIIKSGTFQSFAELKQTFNSADYVNGKTIFDIKGNHYRIIAVIHYQYQKVYIRHVLTHKEYDESSWQ